MRSIGGIYGFPADNKLGVTDANTIRPREYFDAVFRELDQPPKESVLLIGDSLTSDMRGGVDYGIDTCWYNPAGKTTELLVTYQISQLQELVKLLK